MLTVRDRVAQRAAQQALEPLWEPTFLDCSFGFRPGLSIDNAITCAQQLRAGGNPWAVDGDIAACFDTLDHNLMMTHIRRKVADGRVTRLVQNWLDAGLMQAGLPQQTEHPLAERVEQASSAMQRTIDWALGTVAQENDPYGAARYETLRSDGAQRYREPNSEEITVVSDQDALTVNLRRQALQQIATNGLIWGASLLRPAVQSLGRTALTTFSSPAGRRLLRKSALASGGLAGVAALAAAGAYVLNRKAGPVPAGVLQGSPLSPLLANIYLHPFDLMLQRKHHHIVRFADDWVILCAEQQCAEVAYNEAIGALARLRLKINREKTVLRAPGEAFEWLGAMIQ